MDRDLKTLVQVHPDLLAIQSVDGWERKVRNGELFHYTNVLVTPVASAMNTYIRTGTKSVVCRFRGQAQSLTTWTLFENPTTSGTPPANGKNFNRNKSDSTLTKFSGGLTILTDGSVLYKQFSTAGQAPHYLFSGQPTILKPGTDYMFRGFNEAAASNRMTSIVEFYEVAL